MKRFFLVFAALSALVVTAQASESYNKLRSESIKRVVAKAIETYSEDWATEDLGQIWIVSYFSHDDGTGYTIEGRPQDYRFQITSGTATRLQLDVEFPCGSENDESELSGSCSVVATKTKTQWRATIQSCTCG